MEKSQEPSSKKCEKQSSAEVDVEIRCLDCWEVLWVAKASQDGEPRIRCPFKVGDKCKLIAKGCNCGT